jgi:DNA-binding protein YbaB
VDTSWSPEEWESVRASGEAADGLVAVEVDGGGQVLDVTLDPRAMRLPASELAEAVKTALRQAQASARSQVEEIAGRVAARIPSRETLAATLDEVNASAERRMNEFSAALYDLSRRAGNPR